MYQFEVLNLNTGETFTRTYYDLNAARKFAIKCRYSTKVRIVKDVWERYEDYLYVRGRR